METMDIENMPELSDLEECVLERLLLGEKKSSKITSGCGITEITLNVIIEKLVEKGYIDWELNPTDLAYKKIVPCNIYKNTFVGLTVWSLNSKC